MNHTCQAGCQWSLRLSLRAVRRDQRHGINGPSQEAEIRVGGGRFPLREPSGPDGRRAVMVQSQAPGPADVAVYRRDTGAGGRV